MSRLKLYLWANTRELSKLLPNIDGLKLKETVQSISNALDREAKSLLRGRARESTASRKLSCMLSDTIITELKTTMRADSTMPPQDTEHIGRQHGLG